MTPLAAGRSLLRWFRANRRDLPWRRNAHPFRVWVSEIMLQQTRVETVIPYYRRFLRRFPSVQALAKASLDDVLKAWEGLGYYTRARNLHRTAQALVGEHDGEFPDSADEWMSLPGIGEYTAAAIASIAFGEPVPVVDGNVLRVVARLLGKPRPERDEVELYLQSAIDLHRPGDFNQAVMELGQTICVPRSPRCGGCPVRRACRALALGVVERIPAREKAKRVPHYEIAVGVCRKGGRVLVSRRKEEGLLGGLWEFPGGKIRRGEKAEHAVRRELREEAGIDVEVGRKLMVVPHKYSHFSVRLHTYLCRWRRGEARAVGSERVRWTRVAELDRLAFPTANRKILAALTPWRDGPDW